MEYKQVGRWVNNITVTAAQSSQLGHERLQQSICIIASELVLLLGEHC